VPIRLIICLKFLDRTPIPMKCARTDGSAANRSRLPQWVCCRPICPNEAIESAGTDGSGGNQRQVYRRFHRSWKSLQGFHTPSARQLLIDRRTKINAEVSPIIGPRLVSAWGCTATCRPTFAPPFCPLTFALDAVHLLVSFGLYIEY
jgi:hypothetical protein